MTYTRKQDLIQQSELRDGIYVIRTSCSSEEKCARDCVRNYKSLAQVERAFRVLNGELDIRPIHH